MKARTAILIGLALLLIPLFHLQAQIPGTLSYQAFLSDSLGVPKADGTYTITFGLYDVETGGTALWTETKDLDVKQGLFYTHLGPFPASLRFDQPYWLGIQEGSEAELTPRIPLTSVGYSFMALRSDSAQYALLADSAQSATRADTAKVAASALAAADLADDAVTSGKIADGTIQREDVLPDFTAPYADTSDYALVALPGGDAGGDLSGTYPNPTIAANAVNSEKILNGTITGSDISASADLSIASLSTSGNIEVGAAEQEAALNVYGPVNVGGLLAAKAHIVNVVTVTTDSYTTSDTDRVIIVITPAGPLQAPPPAGTSRIPLNGIGPTVSLHSADNVRGQLLDIVLKPSFEYDYVTIMPNGDDNIDGQDYIYLGYYYDSIGVTLVSDGDNWWMVSWIPAFLR